MQGIYVETKNILLIFKCYCYYSYRYIYMEKNLLNYFVKTFVFVKTKKNDI